MATFIAARVPARAPARMRFELDPNDVFHRASTSRDGDDDDDDANRVRVEVHFSGHPATLDANCDAARATIARVAGEHVWARDAPRVTPIAGENACEWSVWVGDDANDAWLAAACALETSSARDARATRVWDDDGEFTLIETAEALPAWVTPERATGTTFLVNGTLVVRDGETLSANGRARTKAALADARGRGDDAGGSAENFEGENGRGEGKGEGKSSRRVCDYAEARRARAATRTAARGGGDRELARARSRGRARGGEDGEL